MNSLAMMAMNMLQNSPEIKNDPLKAEMLKCIREGDDAKGKRLAEQLCNEHGETPQTATTKARRFLGI